MNRLSKKEKGFIYYKSRSYSTPDSVLKAGYKAKDRLIASQIGCRLLQKVNIVEKIEQEKVNLFDTTMITEDYILSGLREIATEGKTEANRVRAYELLGKTKGMFKEVGEFTTKDLTKDAFELIRRYGIDPTQ